MSDSPQTIPLSAPQFRLRHVLLVTTLAAIALGMAAPFLRSATAAQWRLVMCAGTGAFAGFWVIGIVHVRMLPIRLRDAGPLRFKLENVTGGYWLYLAPWVGFACFNAVVMSAEIASQKPQVMRLLLHSFLFGAGVVTSLILDNWSQDAWAGEERLALQGATVPWRLVVVHQDAQPSSIRLRVRGAQVILRGSPEAYAYIVERTMSARVIA